MLVLALHSSDVTFNTSGIALDSSAIYLTLYSLDALWALKIALCNDLFVSYLLKTASNQLSEEEMIEKALQMSRLEYMQSKGI